MTEAQINAEKRSSDLTDVLDVLTPDQIRFVVARLDFNTDKEAAEYIELKPGRIYHWKARGVPIDEAVKLMELDGAITALYLRRRSLAKAMLVKTAGLDLKDDALRQRVATEIIEWEMGKATQRSEHSGPDGGPVEFDVSAWKEKAQRQLGNLAGEEEQE